MSVSAPSPEGSAWAFLNCTLAISMYQSQYSPQMKSWRFRAASPSWNASSSRWVSAATAFSRLTIQRSASRGLRARRQRQRLAQVPGLPSPARWSPRSGRRSTACWRSCGSPRSSSWTSGSRCPAWCPSPERSAGRRCRTVSITSRGLITFPLDLLIFSPSIRTRPWR